MTLRHYNLTEQSAQEPTNYPLKQSLREELSGMREESITMAMVKGEY